MEIDEYLTVDLLVRTSFSLVKYKFGTIANIYLRIESEQRSGLLIDSSL